MKVKLVYPDLGHFPLLYRRFIPVLGPAILAALTPRDVDLCFSDDRVEAVDVAEDADLVGISVMTPQANRAYELADAYRARGIPVVLGGVHASLMPEEAGRHADAVVVGEAEETWPQVLEDARRGRMKPTYRCAKPPESLPLPRWEIFDKSVYIPMNSIQVSRGCPVGCDLCSVPDTFGRSFRMFDTAKLLADMAALDRYIFVVNDNLHLAKRRVRPFLEGMADLGREWVGLAPLEFAQDEEYLRLLRKSNCWAMYVDLSPWVSAGLNEVIDNVPARKAGEYISRVRDHGIKVIASFVFGFDHDRPDIFEKTVAFAREHSIEEVEFHILTPYPGSRLYDRLATEGRLLTTDFSRYTAGSAVYRPRHMSPEDLEAGYLDAWRHFYSDAVVRETEQGPVVKSYASFPLAQGDLLLTESGKWVDSVIDREAVGGR